MKKICQICGKEFETKSYNTKNCNDCKNLKKCVICGKIFETQATERRGGRAGKKTTCSKECSNKLREQTNIEKYGVAHPAQSDKIKEKIKKTNKKKYGVDNVFASKEVLKTLNEKRFEMVKKQQQTMLEKYGYKSVFSRDDVQEKVKESKFKE